MTCSDVIVSGTGTKRKSSSHSGRNIPHIIGKSEQATLKDERMTVPHGPGIPGKSVSLNVNSLYRAIADSKSQENDVQRYLPGALAAGTA